jgi:hypothetical protein
VLVGVSSRRGMCCSTHYTPQQITKQLPRYRGWSASRCAMTSGAMEPPASGFLAPPHLVRAPKDHGLRSEVPGPQAPPLQPTAPTGPGSGDGPHPFFSLRRAFACCLELRELRTKPGVDAHPLALGSNRAGLFVGLFVSCCSSGGRRSSLLIDLLQV